MSQPFVTAQLPSRTVKTDGKEYLWFSGTDYLGMGYNPLLLNLLSKGFQEWGTHFGSSRNNSLQLEVYHEAEQTLARFTGAEDALLVSSGMLAGFLTRSVLPQTISEIYPACLVRELEAPNLHPALSRVPVKGVDWDEWANSAASQLRQGQGTEFRLVYCDSIGSPQPVLFNFELLKSLPNTLLVADDSHGIGVLGEGGRGSFLKLRETGEILVIASLNKAMGIPGGVLLGPHPLLRNIRQSAQFSGASPFPPVYALALTEMIIKGEYERAHATMQSRNNLFLERLTVRKHFTFIPGYPVYTTTDDGLFAYLLSRNILASRFAYPSPSDPALTRLVITAAHTPEDVEILAESCNSYFQGES